MTDYARRKVRCLSNCRFQARSCPIAGLSRRRLPRGRLQPHGAPPSGGGTTPGRPRDAAGAPSGRHAAPGRLPDAGACCVAPGRAAPPRCGHAPARPAARAAGRGGGLRRTALRRFPAVAPLREGEEPPNGPRSLALPSWDHRPVGRGIVPWLGASNAIARIRTSVPELHQEAARRGESRDCRLFGSCTRRHSRWRGASSPCRPWTIPRYPTKGCKGRR